MFYDGQPIPGRHLSFTGLLTVAAAALVQAAALALLPYDHVLALTTLAAVCLMTFAVALLLCGLARAFGHIRDLRHHLARALTDPVTGLPVRRVAEDAIACTEPTATLTVALADVDHLHDFNNAHGHAAGDLYLHAIADRLRLTADEDGMAARLGGDEFAVISRRTPNELANALSDALRAPVAIHGRQHPIQVSIGICRLAGADPHRLFGCADQAMFTARRRNTGIEHYDPTRDGTPLPHGVRPPVRPRDQIVLQQPLDSDELPTGLLACPKCGATDLATVEQIPGNCFGQITRYDDGDVRIDCGEYTHVAWDRQVSIGVRCEECPWHFLGSDWAVRLVAARSGDAQDSGEDCER